MKKRLYKLLAVITAITVLASVPLSISAKSPNGNSEKKIEVKTEIKADKKIEIKEDKKAEAKSEEKQDKKVEVKLEVKQDKKTEAKPEVKQDKKTQSGKEASKSKKPVKKDPTLEKLNAIDKKINSVEIELDRLTVHINAVVSTTTGSAISTTSSAITVPSPTAVASTTGSAISVKLPKGQSLTGFVNGNKGKLSALSNRLKEIEKSLKAIKVNKANTEKYNSLVTKLNTVKAKLLADIKLLNSLLPKK